ncbi:MAG: hypothetical protein ABIJ16_07400 [Bacteroidota bacterium]
MKLRTLIPFFCLVILLNACVNSPDRDTEINLISEAESALYKDTMAFYLDMEVARNIINKYVAFADQFPDDTMSAEYLFKAGEVCRAMNLGEESIRYYERVYSDFPAFEKAPYCLFLKAFVYENIVMDMMKAKEFYTLFIEEFPEHEFADDARALIKNLGKTPEELIRSFEEQNRLNQDSLATDSFPIQ